MSSGWVSPIILSIIFFLSDFNLGSSMVYTDSEPDKINSGPTGSPSRVNVQFGFGITFGRSNFPASIFAL
jgi:hypothetical protein